MYKNLAVIAISVAVLSGCVTPIEGDKLGGASAGDSSQTPATDRAITTQADAVSRLNEATYQVAPLVTECKVALKDNPALAAAKKAYADVYTAGNTLSATAADLIETNNWDSGTITRLKSQLAQRIDALNTACQVDQAGGSAIDVAGAVVDVLWKIYDGYKTRQTQPRKDLAAIIRKKTFPLWESIA